MHIDSLDRCFPVPGLTSIGRKVYMYVDVEELSQMDNGTIEARAGNYLLFSLSCMSVNAAFSHELASAIYVHKPMHLKNMASSSCFKCAARYPLPKVRWLTSSLMSKNYSRRR